MLSRIGTNLVRGFLMGSADIVPGVSGGTVALLVGIYDDLVHNIKTGARALGSAAKLDFGTSKDLLAQVDWPFIAPLLVGVLAAIAALSSAIESLLHDYPEAMAGLFTGLVAASIVVAARMVDRWNGVTIVIVFAVSAAVFVLLGYQSGPATNPNAAVWFGAGALAVCAMILPGISGSFLLLMVGMYAPVLRAVNEREIGNLLVLMAGVVIGLALFSNVLSYFLEQWRDFTMAALVGLMAGSVRVLWPWPHGVGVVSEESDEVVNGTGLDWPATGEAFAPTALGVAAFLVVLGLTVLAQRMSSLSERA